MNLGVPEILTILMLLLVVVGIIYGLARLLGRAFGQGQKDAERRQD